MQRAESEWMREKRSNITVVVTGTSCTILLLAANKCYGSSKGQQSLLALFPQSTTRERGFTPKVITDFGPGGDPPLRSPATVRKPSRNGAT